MSTIHIDYAVPVTVVVDTDTGIIERVVVDDEMVELVVPHTGSDETGAEVPEDLLRQAADIAEESHWPAWEVGW